MNLLQKITRTLVAIVVPFFLLLGSARVLFTPPFLQVEYRVYQVPPDDYGFTTEERLKWANITLQYLFKTADPSFVSDLTFPDGSPLYTDRELDHMEDVKLVVQQVLLIWYTVSALLVVSGVVAWRGKWLREYLKALVFGGWLTIGLILAILVALVIDFDAFFTAFHGLFFEGNSWIFYYSDTFIRLFPIPFWQNAFITLGAFTLLGGCLFGFLGIRLQRRIPETKSAGS